MTKIYYGTNDKMSIQVELLTWKYIV